MHHVFLNKNKIKRILKNEYMYARITTKKHALTLTHMWGWKKEPFLN